MARKKSTKKLNTDDTPVVNSKTESMSTLYYHGTVSVSLAKGKKIISTKKFHNEGGDSLFKFLNLCLAGQYNQANNNRPCRIQLYYNAKETPATSEDTLTSLTNKILYVQSPEVSYLNNTWATNLHFNIPFTQLLINNQSSIEINQARLFPNELTEQISSFSANYMFVKKDSEDNLIWDPLVIDAVNDTNVNIIIDWNLTVNNKES